MLEDVFKLKDADYFRTRTIKKDYQPLAIGGLYLDGRVIKYEINLKNPEKNE